MLRVEAVRKTRSSSADISNLAGLDRSSMIYPLVAAAYSTVAPDGLWSFVLETSVPTERDRWGEEENEMADKPPVLILG